MYFVSTCSNPEYVMKNCAFILPLLLLLAALPASAEILNIPDDFETIQAAINAAEEEDTVLVAPGEYVENISYEGKDITVASLFIIDGDEDHIGETVIDGNQEGSVVLFFERVTENARLSGFTLRNGCGTSYGYGNLFGGGIFIMQSDVVIDHCVIRDNIVEDTFGEPFGGGIFCAGWEQVSHPTIRDCGIFDNASEGYGGGLAIIGDFNPTIERVVIRDNVALEGGGIDFCEGNATIKYCTIYHNQAEDFGGGISATVASTVELQNVTIAENTAGRNGGAVWINHRVEINAVNSISWVTEPDEIFFLDGRNDPSSITVSFCDVLGGWDGIIANEDDEVVWGEGNINADPLFVDAENGDFHLTEDSPCIDAGDPESPRDPDRTRIEMGAFYYPQQPFLIPLHAGWQMVSSPVDPRNPDMEDMFDYLVRLGMVPFVKDHFGHFFFPAWGYNDLEPWDVCFGYLVRMNEPDTLVIAGQLVPIDTPIPMVRGWSIVSYFPEENLPAPEAFANIEEAFVMAKDDSGRFYFPAWHYNGMDLLTRGDGYLVKVSQAVDLVWNVPDEGRMMASGDRRCEESRQVGMTKQSLAYSVNEGIASLRSQRRNGQSDEIASPGESGSQRRELPTKYRYNMTDRNMSILIANQQSSIDNREIGAFTESGLCVGAAIIKTPPPSVEKGEGMTGLAVWGDDPTTDEIDGAQEGETLVFRIWDGCSEHAAALEFIEGEPVYITDGFAVLAVSKQENVPCRFELTSIHPNPFNSTTTISYSLDHDTHISVKIFDLQGSEVATLFDGLKQSGSYRQVFQADKLSSGVYFCRIEDAANRQHIRKMVLLK